MKPNHISTILLVILLMTDVCWSQCRNANWWGSFDAQGWSTCDSTTEYLTGFYRNNQLGGDPIYLLEEATCCKAPAPNQYQASTCKDANWWGVLDGINVWAVCPDGHFMQGLYRTSNHNLHNIEAARCCKPDNLPNSYLSCYDHDVGVSFDKIGWNNCDDGYYLAGIYKGVCDVLHCIEKFRCCKMDAGCFNNAVGVGSVSVIPDSLISASSQYSSGYQAAYGRLNGDRGDGWCAQEAARNDDWLQVDLGKPNKVCALASQGDRNGNEWVTAFKLLYSSDGSSWNTYKDGSGTDVEFHRTGDSNTIDQHMLLAPVSARFFRFNPTQRQNWNCLRVEIYGNIDIGMCASAPCKNGATCVDLVASYRCDCAPGWLGITCEDSEIDNCQQM